MRASRSSVVGSSPLFDGRQRGCAVALVAVSLLASGLDACTLITDVDREKIPQPATPTFPEIDAGPQPTDPPLDASVPDASAPPDEASDAGADGGLDAGSDDAGDAASPDGDAG